MDIIRHKNLESQQGIALIIVVGMLALMMLMGVAFAIFMRTERVAAGSFKTDVRARSLLQVALHQAIEAIDTSMANAVYPSWEVMKSSGGNYVKEPLTQSMMNEIPFAALTPQGTCAQGTANTVSAPAGIPGVGKGVVINLTDHSFGIVTNVVGNTAYHTTLSGGTLNTWSAGDQFYFLQPVLVTAAPLANVGGGAYGYVIVNCSGLLDANSVGGAARGVGSSVAELQLQALPEGVDTNKLVSERTSANFETVQELLVRGMNKIVFTAENPQHFVCYSSATTNDEKVYIGGSASNLYDHQTEIFNELTSLTCQDTNTITMSFSAKQARILITNLIDYVDADRIPGNMNGNAPCNPSGPSVEAFPMANEVLISNVIYCAYDVVTSNYTINGTLNCFAEFTFPFKGLTSFEKGGYKLGFCVITGGTAAVEYYPTTGSLFSEQIASPANWQGGEYIVRSVSASTPLITVPNLSFTNNALLSYGVSLWVKDPSGVVVDLVTNPVVPVGPFTWSVQTMANKDVRLTYLGNSECADPRLNYDATPAALQWFSPSYSGRESLNSLGTTNYRAIYSWNKDPANPILNINARGLAEGRDGDTAMYVPAIGTNLTTVGELGYLFYGDMWETVRLFKRGSNPGYGKVHAVLDHFTTDNLANGVPKGRVNPNTLDTVVLGAIFANLPPNKPHGGATPISSSQLAAIKAAITGRTSVNAFGSLAGLGSIRWDLVDPTWNSLDQESVIRNSAGLLNVRQNLFLILLYGDVTKTDIAGFSASISSVMGVAEVWRDPGDPVNHYPVNIRSFQIMESP